MTTSLFYTRGRPAVVAPRPSRPGHSTRAGPAPHGPVPRPAEDDVVPRVVLQAADAGVVGAQRRGLAPLERFERATRTLPSTQPTTAVASSPANVAARQAVGCVAAATSGRSRFVVLRALGRREEHVRACRAELDARDAVLGRVREVEEGLRGYEIGHADLFLFCGDRRRRRAVLGSAQRFERPLACGGWPSEPQIHARRAALARI